MGYSDFFGTTVSTENALEIKVMLQEEKANGNRFASFPLGANSLGKEDFAAFRSAFSAMEHAYENSTDLDKYATASISSAQNAINNILQSEKEQSSRHQQDNKAQQQIEAEERRPRDQGLSR